MKKYFATLFRMSSIGIIRVLAGMVGFVLLVAFAPLHAFSTTTAIVVDVLDAPISPSAGDVIPFLRVDVTTNVYINMIMSYKLSLSGADADAGNYEVVIKQDTDNDGTFAGGFTSVNGTSISGTTSPVTITP